MVKVDAIIVTYNRLEKLKHALECYEHQTIPFRNVIVVDNHSTDGTTAFLKEWEQIPRQFGKHVLYLDSNYGGSGGFYEGEKYALTLEPDWVFISDDDAYPEKKMVEKFHLFFVKHQGETISAICASVIDMDGNIIYDCRSRFQVDKKGVHQQLVDAEEYEKAYFELNCFSYVGIFINAEGLRKKGLVNKDFFIYQDDIEHSIRLSGFGTMYCVPDIIVTHDSLPQEKTSKAILSASLWKEYYAVRNRAYLLLKHYPCAGRSFIINTLLNIRARKGKSLSAVAKMALEGIKDARNGEMGVHPTYRPGLVIESNANLPYPKFRWAIVYPLFRVIRLLKK